MENLNINNRTVGPGHPPYLIAEIGSNYNGDMALARKMVDAAKQAGAHAVKFQSWSKQSLISKAEYARNTEYADTHRHFGTLEEMCAKYQFTPEQHRKMVAYCKGVGVDFLSSAFSLPEVDLLMELDVPCLKVASMDVNHLPLLAHIGTTGKPVLLSTGMATLGEVERAVAVLRENGSGPICVLHCVAIYPPDHRDIHLRNIPMLEQALDVPVGFSDHTIGVAIPLAAIALGACVIEKHFTLDKEMAGWDHWISADPDELAAMASDGLKVFHSLGKYERVVSPAEQEKKKAFRRRIVLKNNVTNGHRLCFADLDYKRPGTGIHPDEAAYVVDRVVNRDLEEDHELEWDDLG